MKNNIFNIVLAACLLIFNQSCTKPPCDCDFININSIAITIVNQQGQNLISGANAIYIADSMRVLNKKNSFDVDDASILKNPADSTSLLFSFYSTESVKSYIYYNSQSPQDSIEVIRTTKTGNCCGSSLEYKEIETVKFNNTLITPINGKLIFVK